jgi:hypothetical protein
MDSMVTDEEIQTVVDAGTNFVLMFPAAGGNAVNGELVRHYVAARSATWLRRLSALASMRCTTI